MFQQYGPPTYVRSDGPECITRVLRRLLKEYKVGTSYIEPGSPWHYVEYATFRDELLDCEIFSTLLEAKVLSKQCCRFYNEFRLHSGLNYKTPREVASLYREATSRLPLHPNNRCQY